MSQDLSYYIDPIGLSRGKSCGQAAFNLRMKKLKEEEEKLKIIADEEKQLAEERAQFDREQREDDFKNAMEAINNR